MLGHSDCSCGRTWLRAESNYQSEPTKAVGEQKQCPENVLTVWQHFVAWIKDFKSSFALLCWRHRYYWADNWASLALYFKEYRTQTTPNLATALWHKVVSITESTLHHFHGQGPELQPDIWPLIPSFSFPGHLWETNAAGFQRNCWVNCWTDGEAVLQERTPVSRKWWALLGGIPQKCIERVSTEKLVRLFITKMAGDWEMKRRITSQWQDTTGYNRRTLFLDVQVD